MGFSHAGRWGKRCAWIGNPGLRIIARTMSPDRAEEELERLTKLYAAMTEGELRKVADDAPDLTEEARRALVGEIGRRGLDIRLPDYLPGDEVEVLELLTVRKFRDLPEALLVKGILDSAGIESFLADDNMVRMNWFMSNFFGGIKLMVKAEDVDAANDVLGQAIPEGFEVEGVGTYQQPRCPKCQSIEVIFEALHKPIAYTTAWLGVPLPIAKNTWKCESCGHRWPDTPDSDG